MARPRKSSVGGLSRQYIYNLRSELNELHERIALEPTSIYSLDWKKRIAEIKAMLGPEVVPFRERRRQALADAVDTTPLEGDEALRLMEEEIEKRKLSEASNPDRNGS